MVKALQAAQVQSVREITKKADLKKANKKISNIVVVFLLLLIFAFIAYKSHSYYQNTRFDFSETESGIVFNSKDMPIRDAIKIVIDNNSVSIIANTSTTDSNSAEAVTDSVVLLTTILATENKTVTIFINVLNEKGQLIYCSSNLGDVYTNKDLNAEDCISKIKDLETTIQIDYPNNKLKEPTVNIYPLDKKIIIKPKTKDNMLTSSYLLLKSRFLDIEKRLSKVEAFKKKIGDIQANQPQEPKENNVSDTNN